MKPSEMGLHRIVRYEVKLKSNCRETQEVEIIEHAKNVHDGIAEFIYPEGKVALTMNVFFARHYSLTFYIKGYVDCEIFNLLVKYIDRERRPKR